MGSVEDAWVVLARAWFFDPDGRLPTALARVGHLRRVATTPGTEIYRGDRKKPHEETDDR